MLSQYQTISQTAPLLPDLSYMILFKKKFSERPVYKNKKEIINEKKKEDYDH